MSAPEHISTQIAQKTDQELLGMFDSPYDWLPETLDAAVVELQKRNITNNQVNRVISEILRPANVVGAAKTVPLRDRARAMIMPDQGVCLLIIIIGIIVALAGLALSVSSFTSEWTGHRAAGLLGSVGLLLSGSLIAYLGWSLMKRQKKPAQTRRFPPCLAYSHNASELPQEHLIRAVLLGQAIPVASASLTCWGAINLGMWLFGYQEIVVQFAKIPAPPGTFNVFIYGLCVIALIMLAFGVYGGVTKMPFVGYLDGIALIGVGIWNLWHDFGLEAALTPYGYHVEGWQQWNYQGWTLWRLLGACQVVWGIRQIFRFWRFGFHPGGQKQVIASDVLKTLRQIIRAPARPEVGRIKLRVESDFFDPSAVKSGTYTVWLLPDKAVCLHDQLRDYFKYDRRALSTTPFETNIGWGTKEVRLPLESHHVWLDREAGQAILNWLKDDQ